MATNSSASTTILKKTVQDFKFIKEIGTGSYSTVYLAKEISTDQELAIKAVSKDLVTRVKKVAQVLREKEILARLIDCPYAVHLYCTFQDEKTLYFGLSYFSNGDLLQYINDAGHFSDEIVRFYTAELVESIEHLHQRRIIHRDLKPENILLTNTMHIRITDFGSGVIVDETDNSTNVSQRRNSFVGTAQFVAPEILQHLPVHFGSDFWSLGCVIYQMATGKHLFHGYHEYDIFNAVVRVAYTLPDDFPPMIGDLIEKLVRFEPKERLGTIEMGGISTLKGHPFFSEHDYVEKWGQLLTLESPLKSKDKFNTKASLSESIK